MNLCNCDGVHLFDRFDQPGADLPAPEDDSAEEAGWFSTETDPAIVQAVVAELPEREDEALGA